MIEIEQIGPVSKFRLARTIFGKGHYFTAAYWVDGLMVDTGGAYTVNELLAALKNRFVTTIVNTHSHEDHFAGNAAICRKFNAKVFAHPLALPVLAAPREKQPQQFYRRLFWGYPEPSPGSAIEKQVATENNLFGVIPTPGHSPDSICLYEKSEGWIFCGDAFVGGKDQALRPTSNIWQIIDSLKILGKLDASYLFPGSGTAYDKPQKIIANKIEYLEELGEQILHLHSQGWSVNRIRRKLFDVQSLMALVTFGDYSPYHLIRSYIEHHPSKILDKGKSS